MAKKTTVTPRFKKPHPPNFIREWRKIIFISAEVQLDLIFSLA